MQTLTQIRDFRLFLTARFFGTLGVHTLALTHAWQIYEMTGSPTALGLIGLFQFLPLFLLCLPAGQVADRFEKHRIMSLCHTLFLFGALASSWFSFQGQMSTGLIYAIVFVMGLCRAFIAPATQSFLPRLCTENLLPRLIATNTTVWQVASIMGPMVAGLLLAALQHFYWVYALGALCLVISTTAVLLIQTRSGSRRDTRFRLDNLLEGVRFVKSSPLLFGALSLDLFAVLLGGATALMPIFAKDILDAGAQGLGLLRASPGVGAALMGLYLSFRPIRVNAGKKLFYAVSAFGALTIAFALSRNLWLSIAILVCLGATDLISVIVRQSLIQLGTPDHMRGRVSSVSQLFIGASNELGEIESGFTAAWFGVVPAVLLGGAGTIVVAVLWQRWFPQLRRMNELSDAAKAA